jgi:hypothetical protein
MWRSAVHVIFASDGSRSPPLPRGDRALDGLVGMRQEEARRALAELGVAERAVEFLGFPDGTLSTTAAAAIGAGGAHSRAAAGPRVRPFRYDRHPDHLAVNRAVTGLQSEQRIQAEVWEYFVYSQWRLLPSGDVRTYFAARTLRDLQRGRSGRKRRALDATGARPPCSPPRSKGRSSPRRCSIGFVANRRPSFVSAPTFRDDKVLEASRWWIPVAHRLEPVLKRLKDRVVTATAWNMTSAVPRNGPAVRVESAPRIRVVLFGGDLPAASPGHSAFSC